MKSLEEVLTKYKKSKEPVFVVYKTHSPSVSHPIMNIIEDFNEETGFVQIGHYNKDLDGNKIKTIVYTTKDEISRILVEKK